MARKILLVEDDADFSAVLGVALEIEGFTVHRAPGGEKALEVLACERPDLIITDLEMGGTDGRALCRLARADHRLSDVPIVILSAFIDPDDSGSLFDVPADCFVSKQVPITQLIDLIKDLLSGTSQRTQSGRIHVV